MREPGARDKKGIVRLESLTHAKINMNVTLMRFIDNTAGVGVCWGLSAVDSMRSLFGKGRVDNSKPVKRVLAIKLLGLGTILLTPGLIKSLRKLIPGVQVDFLTFEQFRPAVELVGGIDRLYPLSARSP